jgi:type I restriction enzyme S subunit
MIFSIENATTQLPAGWAWARLDDISEKAETVNPIDSPNKEFLYLDITSIDNEQRITNPKRILGKNAPSRARQLVRTGDIIFSTVRTYLRNIAYVNEPYDGQIASTGFCVIRPYFPINSKFIFFIIQTDDFVNPLTKLQRGTHYPAVRNSDVFAQMIPLAPISEQNRIVSKITELFSQSEVAKESIGRIPTILKNFRQAMLDTACNGRLTASWRNNFGMKSSEQVVKGLEKERQRSYEVDCHELTSNSSARRLPAMEFRSIDRGVPDSWIGMTLESGCTFIIDCPHSTPKFTRDGQYCIDTTCVEPSHILWSKARKVSNDDFKKRTTRMMPRENDLLFSREGTIGTVVRVPPHAKICLGQRIMLFRFAPFILPGFAELLMQSTKFIEQYRSLILGTSSPHLNIRDIRKLTIFVPDIKEQKEIIRRTDAIIELVNLIEEKCKMAKTQIDSLPQAIVAKAFRGELVPQKASEEPGSILLDRIRSERKKKSGISKINKFHDNLKQMTSN